MRRPRTAVALAAAALLALLTLVLGASKAERAALLALKGAILEDPGQVLASWTEGSNPCGGGGIAADGSPLPAWGGVTCDEEGAVVAVDLASTGGERLSGTLPSALAALPDLLTL